tara:strand:+ start:54 stop:278 length:225 start_codon:yes stop_codon:yes gene_type:complete
MNIFKNIILKFLRKISIITYYTVPEEYVDFTDHSISKALKKNMNQEIFDELFESYEYTYKTFNIKGKQTIVQIN